MISRVAESCFWLTRYLERVDTGSRLLGVNAGFSLDVELARAGRWRPLVIVMGQEEDFLARFGESEIEDGEIVQRYLVWDADNPFSVYSSLRAVRSNARTIREAMSVEMWEAVNDLWLWMNGRPAKRLYDREREAFYQHVCSQCLMFHGTTYSTMLHDTPYTFLAFGRAIERAGQSARLLDLRHHALQDRDPADVEGVEAVDAAEWIAILRSCSAYEPFFKRAEHVLSGAAVAEFVLFDRTFPRSVLHNLDRSRGLLARLLAGEAPGHRSASWEALERLRGSLLQMDIDDVRHLGLHETCTWLVDDLARLCETIHAEFFDPSIESLRARLPGILAQQQTAGTGSPSSTRQSQGTGETPFQEQGASAPPPQGGVSPG